MTKIDNFLKRIVSICIYTIIGFGVSAYISAWFGIDTVPILAIIVGVFGGELLLTVILELSKKKMSKQKGEPTDGKD